MTFTVTRTGDPDETSTVAYATSNETATAGTRPDRHADGRARRDDDRHHPSQGDTKAEGNETFYLDLFGNGGNALLVDGRVVGTIVNDDRRAGHRARPFRPSGSRRVARLVHRTARGLGQSLIAESPGSRSGDGSAVRPTEEPPTPKPKWPVGRW